MSSIFRDANVASPIVFRKLNPFVVFCIFLGLYYFTFSIIPFLEAAPLPAIEAEKLRAWNEDNRQEGALLLDLVTKREATGRRDRAIDAIAVVVFVESGKIFLSLGTLRRLCNNLLFPTKRENGKAGSWMQMINTVVHIDNK
jgi:hypothetical protein